MMLDFDTVSELAGASRIKKYVKKNKLPSVDAFVMECIISAYMNDALCTAISHSVAIEQAPKETD